MVVMMMMIMMMMMMMMIMMMMVMIMMLPDSLSFFSRRSRGRRVRESECCHDSTWKM
jgi:uncharacterized protein HemY